MSEGALQVLDMLEQSEKSAALVQLADTVAHDLNNIFTAVIGNLAFLDRAAAKDKLSAEAIDEVRRTAERGIALSAKLQSLARTR